MTGRQSAGANLLVSRSAPTISSMIFRLERKKELSAILQRAKADNLPVALVGVALPANDQDEREQAYARSIPISPSNSACPIFPNMLGPIAGGRSCCCRTASIRPKKASRHGRRIAGFLSAGEDLG